MLADTSTTEPTTEPRALQFPTDELAIVAWPDPVIDELGHDPRSAYVERFWLSILGPSSIMSGCLVIG
jgi:hypothetical protein